MGEEARPGPLQSLGFAVELELGRGEGGTGGGAVAAARGRSCCRERMLTPPGAAAAGEDGKVCFFFFCFFSFPRSFRCRARVSQRSWSLREGKEAEKPPPLPLPREDPVAGSGCWRRRELLPPEKMTSALRVLKSADVILSEDTRHSGKLLKYYDIKAPMLSYHKFNESQRETMILRRLQEGQIVALISDAGTPSISDPGVELAKLCVTENILVIPIPGPSAVVAALSASGLPTTEFTFVGFLPKHAGSRRDRLVVSANEAATQIFFVPPHKLHQFLNEAASIFGASRLCVVAREMTKLHEEFWRGTLDAAINAFSSRQPKGEITLLIEGKPNSVSEVPSEDELAQELKDMIDSGHSISMAVKLVVEGSLAKRKHVYALALRLFGKAMEVDE